MTAAQPASMTVTAADGVAHTALVFAAAEPTRHVALILPAMGVPASYYEPFGQALAAKGLSAVAMELRGTGSSTVAASRAVDFGYDEIVRLDIVAAVAAIRQQLGDVVVHAVGHSLGGQLAALALARDPQLFASLILAASGSVDHRGFGFPKRYGVLAQTQLAAAVAHTLGYFPGHRLGFGGRQPRRLIADWARQIRTGVYAPSGPDYDYEAALRRVACPVLGLSLQGDTLTTAKSTDLLCAKLAGCRHDRRHLRLALGVQDGAQVHFRWARQPDEMAGLIVRWVTDNFDRQVVSAEAS